MTAALGGPAKWASLRPEATHLAAAGPLSGTVTSMRYLGSATRVSLHVGQTEIAALVPAGQSLPEIGATSAFGFAPEALHLMAGE